MGIYWREMEGGSFEEFDGSEVGFRA